MRWRSAISCAAAMAAVLGLAGCMTGTRVQWGLDAHGCEQVHGATVKWVFERDGAVLDEIGFPCADGEEQLAVPPGTTDQLAGLYDASSHLIARCDVEYRRGGEFCDFGVP